MTKDVENFPIFKATFGCLLLLFCLILLSPNAVKSAEDVINGSEPITFVHLGDPQFGYSLDSKSGILRRMSELFAEVNAEKPQFIIIPGDLVQDRTIAQRWAFQKSIRATELPLILTPGNHDITNPQDLRNFQKRYGADYSVSNYGKVRVVSLNSEILRDSSISDVEFTHQWEWLEATIDEYLEEDSDQSEMVFVTHRPPFVYDIDEAETSQNWPLETRKRLLELAKRARVKIICVGHTHTTTVIDVPEYGLTIYTVGGAARVFDDEGTGYRLFKILSDGYQQQYKRTGTPPSQAIGWAGYKQWTPRIWDFSFRHWFWTLCFFAIGILMIRRSRDESASSQIGWSRALLICGGWHLFFAVNMQLDFDELITELARSWLRDDGLIKLYRHQISPFVVAFIGIGLPFTLYWWCRGVKKTWLLITLLLLILPTVVWFGMQVASNHFLGILWSESIWDYTFAITLVAITLLLRNDRKWFS